MNPALHSPSSPRRKWLRRALLGLILAPILVAGGCCLFHRGPYRTPEPLPDAKLLDMHCHVAGLGEKASGCFVSTSIQRSYKFA